MLNKRFDVFSVDSFKNTVGGMQNLINSGKVNDIAKVYGNHTNGVWEHCADFLAGDSDECLDVVKFYTDTCNIGGYLYIAGDVNTTEGCTLGYLVQNNACDVINVYGYTNIEDLVNALNKAYNMLEFFDKLFDKVDNMWDTHPEIMDNLTVKYGCKVNSEYYYNNFENFLKSYNNNGIVHFNSLLNELVAITK